MLTERKIESIVSPKQDIVSIETFNAVNCYQRFLVEERYRQSGIVSLAEQELGRDRYISKMNTAIIKLINLAEERPSIILDCVLTYEESK